MTCEKRYFRWDDVLGLVNADIESFSAGGVGDNDSFQIGSRVYVDGVEITAGVPVAVATCAKGATTHVTVTANWNKLTTEFLTGASIVRVDVYGKLTGAAGWILERIFATEALTDLFLDAGIWSFSYHVERIRVTVVNYAYEFAYGESNSWINNFCHSSGVLLLKRMHVGL